MKKLLWFVIAGSRGGPNRAKIIHTLKERPMNANQLSNTLNLDYKTISHHLKVLEKNYLVTFEGDGYGNMYFLHRDLERNFNIFEEICKKTNIEFNGNGKEEN